MLFFDKLSSMGKSSRELKFQKILQLEQVFTQIQDTDILLERLLTEARAVAHADAGSIYICKDNRIHIKYAQNDTEQRKLSLDEKLPFVYFSFPIDTTSIAGYTVVTAEMVNLPDAYFIPDDKPFIFNKQSDLITGYKTQSILTIPLKSGDNDVLGVLQIINAQDKYGNIVPFDADAELFMQHFAMIAARALERTYLTRAMVMRMMHMAALRDPKETGAHVMRVSYYSVEIYDRWAAEHHIDINEREKFRDMLKIAAMLHDVGKVGISDLILKKPGKFTDDEYSIIKSHTYIGASLFFDGKSSLDHMVREVVLHHHERWDGTGYPGCVEIPHDNPLMFADELPCSSSLAGASIPFAARIVALADVFDALSSKRVYKQAWSEESVLNEIRNQAGKQFDPELVTVFFKIIDRLLVIRSQFPDNV